jgi:hypothetical protein
MTSLRDEVIQLEKVPCPSWPSALKFSLMLYWIYDQKTSKEMSVSQDSVDSSKFILAQK